MRACVALHGYSGEGVPPMFGDFEAQRHWMEVTESYATRVFMRRSVLVCDLLVFLPAALACAAAGAPAGRARLGLFALLCALPPLVLVDHGHFQYNCVSLGLTLWAMHAAMRRSAAEAVRRALLLLSPVATGAVESMLSPHMRVVTLVCAFVA